MQAQAEEMAPGAIGAEAVVRPEIAGGRVLRTVLLVDDDPDRLLGRVDVLRRPGIRALEATDAETALAVVARETVDLVIADPRLPGGSAVSLLAALRRRRPGIRRVLATGGCDESLLREAVNQAGVSYFLPEPWTSEALAELLQDGVAAVAPIPSPLRSGRFPEIIGSSVVIRDLLDLVAKVADTDSTALVTGETGTGKELVGRAIHQASRRRRRVFCAVNSAAFPETLLESELFGHRRGAFTGASSNKKGLFEHAHQGTVFLDEVAEMPLSMQAKLLRFLQTGEIRPVGDETVKRVDVRLVTATNKDLEVEVAAGRFREDLYYRLAVIPIHVPALRERSEDIPGLADHFLARMASRADKRIEGIEPAAVERLVRYAWPGNVRELENVIERGVALCRNDRIGAEDLPARLLETPRPPTADTVQSLPSMERRHILETLERVGWNRRRAAELLEISTTTLWRRLKEFGIERDAGASGAAAEHLTAGRQA